MLLCNFNVNNLFVRYKFGKTFPGDQSGKSESTNPNMGYLPLYQKGGFEIFNDAQRKLAALAISQGGKDLPDVLCVQEVESLIALRAFNETYLGGKFKYAAVIDSRDLRQIDVGVLSMHPIESLTSHVDLRTADGKDYVFSRDCLEVRVRIKKKIVTVFLNHFKSKLAMGDTAEAREKETAKADAKRLLQAKTVASLVRSRFPGSSFENEYFAVLGDMNDTPGSAPLKPLYSKALGLENAFEHLPEEERWTHYWKAKNSVSQLDHILLSPALSSSLKDIWVERRGIGFRAESKKDDGLLPKNVKLDGSKDPLMLDFQFERFPSVSPTDIASDHAAIFLNLKL